MKSTISDVQKKIKVGTHGEDYGSWMSNPVFYVFGGIALVTLVLTALSFTVFRITVLGVVFAAATVILVALLCWMAWIRRQYAFGKGGMTKLAEVVSDQLGIPVDYTVSVDLTGFEALVEAIGGVNFDVPINMDYDDPIQNLSIHFKKGVQYLNGADAMRVVRFRHNNDGTGYGSEDLGRMQTQQKFLKAVAKKMLTASNILTKIDDYAKIFNQYVDTDLSVGNLAWLGTEVLKMGVDKIDFSTLPNEWRSPYIYLIPDETLTLVNTYLNPYVEDRTAEDLHLPS